MRPAGKQQPAAAVDQADVASRVVGAGRAGGEAVQGAVALQQLRAELAATRAALEERKIVDQAKAMGEGDRGPKSTQRPFR